MLCREQFLKYPPEKLNPSIPSLPPIDIQNNKTPRTNINNNIVSDDAPNWLTDDEGDGDVERPCRRRRKKAALPTVDEQIELRVMRCIFEAQKDEVKRVIIRLHEMQMNQRKAKREQGSARGTAPRSFSSVKSNKPKRLSVKKKRPKVPRKRFVGAATLQNNRKVLARVQRRRHAQRKPMKQVKRKKFPRHKRRPNAKTGNRQYRKRIARAQKLFNKGIFITGRKLMEELWKSVRDSFGKTTDFCNNNNIHQGLSKLHLHQLAVYERIEEDLERLNITREERTKAAEERKAKELEKAELREEVKNKMMAKAAAHAENDALRKERRAARKKRALDKKMRQQTAKAEIRLYCKSVA